MNKSNYYASICKGDKKLAERRVYIQEYPSRDRWESRPEHHEYVSFMKRLWDVEDLLKEGYRVYYRYVPSSGSFPILDIAISTPFERLPGHNVW